MSNRTRKIVEEVLAMPVSERAIVAEKVISSLEPQAGQDVEAAWQDECARRLRQVEEGEVELEPWEAVRDRIRGRLSVTR